jgi:hypothetical protein
MKKTKNRPVRFDFINLKPKKSNPNKKNPEKTRAKPEKNRAKPEKPSQTGKTVFVLKTEPNRNRFRFEPVSV